MSAQPPTTNALKSPRRGRGRRLLPVALYAPNLIGYARIALSAYAFCSHERPWTFLCAYFSGFLLDAADGYAARLLDQSSEFGALLDMLTDRCSTAGLLVILARTYAVAGANILYVPLFLSLVLLDAVSHFMQVCAGLSAGSASHKGAVAAATGYGEEEDDDDGGGDSARKRSGRGEPSSSSSSLSFVARVVQLYYRRTVLGIVCLLNEAFFVLLYMRPHVSGVMATTTTTMTMKRPAMTLSPGAALLFEVLTWAVCAPVCALKQAVSLAQIVSASAALSAAGRRRATAPAPS